MTVQYTRNMHQDFIYWEYLCADSAGGVKCKSPVEIKGRQDTEYVVGSNEDGQETLNRASLILSQPVKTQSFIKEGLIKDLDDPDADPQEIDDAWSINQYIETWSTNGIVRQSTARIMKK